MDEASLERTEGPWRKVTVMGWLLGSLGMIVIEASYLPQILRLHRLKRADDVSYLFPLLNVIGRLLALIYSATRGENVFVIGFFLGILLRGTLLFQVVWYRRLRRAVDTDAGVVVTS